MITVTYNETSLSLASASDASEHDEVELINDLVASGSELGCADQITDIQSLMVLNIFSLGILAGLVMGAILWRTSK